MNTRAIVVAAGLTLSLVACGKEHYAVHPVPPPWLEGVVVEQAQQGGGQGSVLLGQMYKAVAYSKGESTQWQIPLEGGSCYWFSTAGDQTVEGLSLYLWDPDGDRLDTVRGKGPRSMLAYCVSIPGLYKFEAKVTRGYGHYHMGVFAKGAPQGAPPPLPPPATLPPPPNAEPDLGAVVEEIAASAAPGAARLGEMFDGTADQTDWYVQLDTDKCYWLIGAGDQGVNELYIYLWDPKDKRITVNKSENNRVTVGHCPEVAGMYHFQAKVNTGSGKYKVGVYAKKK